MYGGGQQLICSLRAFFGQDSGAEDVMRFAYHVAQCFQVVLFACHEQTVAPQRRDCNRLLFVSNATLGHYRTSSRNPFPNWTMTTSPPATQSLISATC